MSGTPGAGSLEAMARNSGFSAASAVRDVGNGTPAIRISLTAALQPSRSFACRSLSALVHGFRGLWLGRLLTRLRHRLVPIRLRVRLPRIWTFPAHFPAAPQRRARPSAKDRSSRTSKAASNSAGCALSGRCNGGRRMRTNALQHGRQSNALGVGVRRQPGLEDRIREMRMG
jgi:hypothetical protein